MTRSFSFYLVIFGQCLVIQSSNSKGEICRKDQYTIKNSTGSFLRCLDCGTCHEGRGLEPPCGSTLHDPPMTSCGICKSGTFSSNNDISSCLACHHCAPHEIKTAECTDKSDTVCSGKCEKSYFMTKTAPRTCRECSACCEDGSDERIPECVSQRIKLNVCSPRQDKECGGSGPGDTKASKDSGGLSTTSIIPISIGCVIFFSVAVTLIVMMYIIKRKRNRLNSQSLPESAAGAQSQNGSALTTYEAYASEGPQTVHGSVALKHCSLNPHYEGTPCAEKKPIPGTSAEVPAEEKFQSPDDTNVDKASMSRQVSQDSQTSGDGQVKFRKRSLSSRSAGEILEKVSNSLKRNGSPSLLESEEDSETHVPIKISTHPKSQAPKEGSRVELSCKLEKKNKNFMYQWFKDGASMIGKNDTSLVLDPVRLRDFGSYMCRVSYRDSFADAVNSKPAKLDVIPVRRNGMRLTLLSELDIDTIDCVASLLESKKHGLGDWRRIAFEYRMKAEDINSLEIKTEPGKKVLAFLNSSTPSLTVYDFCKKLKEDNVRRLDIVEKLEDRLLVAE